MAWRKPMAWAMEKCAEKATEGTDNPLATRSSPSSSRSRSPRGEGVGVPVLLITDIGADIDDTQALLAILGLPALRLVGLVTCVGDGLARAALARGWLRMLGIEDAHVPIAPSEDALKMGCYVPADPRFPAAADAALEPMGSAPQFILRTAARYAGELVILGIAPLTPLAAALREDKAGVLRGVKRVYLQGNVRVVPAATEGGGAPCLEAQEFAYNFGQDMAAVAEVLEGLQEHVPFSSLGKFAAYRVGVTQAELRTLARPSLPSVLESAQAQMARFRAEKPAIFDRLYPLPRDKRDEARWIEHLPGDVISKPYDPLLVLMANEDAERGGVVATGDCKRSRRAPLFTRQSVGRHEMIGNAQTDGDEGGVPDTAVVKAALLAAMNTAVDRTLDLE